jgi:hypothetical protein
MSGLLTGSGRYGQQAPARDFHAIDGRYIEQAVTGAGSPFFAPQTKRFFSSRSAGSGWRVNNPNGWDHTYVLVTSEQNKYGDYARLYTVRVFVLADHARRVRVYEDSAGFQGYASRDGAHRAGLRVARLIAGGATVRQITGRDVDPDTVAMYAGAGDLGE